MASIAHRRAASTSDMALNLVPLMNLVVCLIPMVLAGAALSPVGVVETQAPRLCSFGCGGVPDAPALALSVHIGPDGFRLSGPGIEDALAAQAAPGPQIPKRAGRLDYPALYEALAAVKAQAPGTHGFTLSAAPGLPYTDVIAVMDLAQVKLSADRLPDARALRAATPLRDAQGVPEPLLPAVRLAVAD